MFSFYGMGIKVKPFGRKPVAQQRPVQILLVFSDVWIIALQVFFGVKLWKMKIQGHKLKNLYEIEFPEPETLSNFNFFIGTGVGPQLPCKAFHVQSVTASSKWLQFMQHFQGFATCSGKVLTAYLEYRSLLQRMHVMYVMWLCVMC